MSCQSTLGMGANQWDMVEQSKSFGKWTVFFGLQEGFAKCEESSFSKDFAASNELSNELSKVKVRKWRYQVLFYTSSLFLHGDNIKYTHVSPNTLTSENQQIKVLGIQSTSTTGEQRSLYMCRISICRRTTKNKKVIGRE